MLCLRPRHSTLIVIVMRETIKLNDTVYRADFKISCRPRKRTTRSQRTPYSSFLPKTPSPQTNWSVTPFFPHTHNHAAFNAVSVGQNIATLF